MHHNTLMRRITATAMLVAVTSFAHAKLPPATPEEQAKLEASKQKAAADAEVEKGLLAKAQDRVVARYKEKTGEQGASQAAAGTTQEVPSAALNSRTTEKAGAYNEGVTPQSAGGALATGSQPDSKQVKQNQEIPDDGKTKIAK